MGERIEEHPGNYLHPSTPLNSEKPATGSPVPFHNLPPPLTPFIRPQHTQQPLTSLLLLRVAGNFERVPEAPPVLGELLQACPSNKIIRTSRAVLPVEGEYEFSVPPLSLPDPLPLPAYEQLLHYAAVALFVQRAQMVKPQFVLSEDNVAAVVLIFIPLVGRPLSLDLAATR